MSVPLKEHKQFNFWTKFGNFDHSAVPSWANALFAEKCAMMQKIVQTRDKVQTVSENLYHNQWGQKNSEVAFDFLIMRLLVILIEHTT